MKLDLITCFGLMLLFLRHINISVTSEPILLSSINSMLTEEETVKYLKQKLVSMHKRTDHDIVFLVDGSRSVRLRNYIFELKIVRTILNGFDVNLNNTRVAVVPFSTPGANVSGILGRESTVCNIDDSK